MRKPPSGPKLGLAEAPQPTAHLDTLLSVFSFLRCKEFGADTLNAVDEEPEEDVVWYSR